MARLYIEGFESGTINNGLWGTSALVIESTTVKTGAYSGKADITSTTEQNNAAITPSKSAIYVKAYVRVNVASNPSATRTQTIFTALTNTFGVIARLQAVVATNGAITLSVLNNVASTTPISGISISADTWYLLEFKCTINASTGILEVKVNGSATTASNQNTGSTNVSNITIGSMIASGTGGTGTIYYDDIVIDDAAYPGASRILTRQPATGGTPTYDGWTKSSGTDAGALWDETPVNATNNCVSPGTGDPLTQSAVIASFASTQTGHGSETIASDATINGAQAIINALRSTGAGRTHKLLRRDNTTDTLETLALSVSNAHYPAPIFSPSSYANLNSAMQLGGEKSGGAGGQSMTINDVWLMVEYTPSPNASVNATGVAAIVGTSATTVSNVTSVTATGVGEITATATTTIQASSAISANNPSAVVAAASNTIQASSVITANGVGVQVATATTTIEIGATVNASGCSIEIATAANTLQASSSITANGCGIIIADSSNTIQASSAITASGCSAIVGTSANTLQIGASVSASGCGVEIATSTNNIQASSSINTGGCGIEIADAQTSLQASSSLAVNGCGILIANSSNTLELSTSLAVNGCGILIGTATTTPHVTIPAFSASLLNEKVIFIRANLPKVNVTADLPTLRLPGELKTV